jgi:alkylated DNA nucleotide flippase Atl1
VLAVVAMIPRGALASYGDVAELLGECDVPCTARQVARALSLFGAQVPWWRVVQSSGSVAEQVFPTARERLLADGIVSDGRRVRLDRLRWQPDPAVLRATLVRGGLV